MFVEQKEERIIETCLLAWASWDERTKLGDVFDILLKIFCHVKEVEGGNNYKIPQ